MHKDYNTSAKRLVLPEYGRQIQNMVDYCVQIADPSERQECAEAIINTMSFFFPKQREREDFWQILWDHLYIMSDFRLEVNYPYAVSEAKEFQSKKTVTLDALHQSAPSFRHYGHGIEKMIKIALNMEKGETREALEKLIAIQMKRSYVLWNKDNVENRRIFTDLYEMSKGEIYLDEFSCVLPEASEILTLAAPNSPNNKKNKNNNKRKKKGA